MLKSEKTANNEEDEEETTTPLLCLGLDRELLRDEEVLHGFQLAVAEVSEAYATKFSLFEEQGLYYFAGYIVKKLLNFHASSCNVCKKFSRKVTTSTDHLHEGEFFIFLKRYDDDLCTLHSPFVEFVSYVYNICHLVNFFFKKYVESALVLQSLQ